MDDEAVTMLRMLRKELSETNEKIDDQAAITTRLVRALERDDRLNERSERAAEAERDRRHREIVESVQELKDVVEAVGVAHRGLPEELLHTVEGKINELRSARWEALQAGVPNEVAPLPPVPRRRDPTGSFRVPQLPAPEDDMALTPAQQHALARAGAWALKHWHVFAASGGTLLLAKFHALIAWITGH